MEAIMTLRHPSLTFAVLAVLFACVAAACAQEQPAPGLASSSRAESEIDMRAEAKLAAVLPAVNFQDAKLQDVIEFLAKATGVNFWVDWRTLKIDQPAVTKDTPITLQLVNVPAEKILRMALAQACPDETNPVDWSIDDGVVTVSTRKEFSKATQMRFYDIRSLLVAGWCPPEPGPQLDLPAVESVAPVQSRPEKLKAISDLIENTVGSPDDWQDKGGTISGLVEFNGFLLIRAPARQHAQVTKLLDQLEETVRHMVAVEARLIVVKTGIVDQALGLGNGQLILDAKSADAFLDKLLRPESAGKCLAMFRMTCHDGEVALIMADHLTNYLQKIAPMGEAGGTGPVSETAYAGSWLLVCPTLNAARQTIILSFACDMGAPPALRQTAFPVAIEAPSPTTKGAAAAEVPATAGPLFPTTQPASRGPGVRGTIVAPRWHMNASGVVTLEMPEQDAVHFGSLIQIPNNGAAIFAASARTVKATAEPDTELILFLRAKSAN
jgi:hypothetical protein